MAHLAPARRRSARRPVDPELTDRSAPKAAGPARWTGPAGVIAIVATVVWELLARTGIVSPVFFPAPSRIAAALWNDLTAGTLPGDIGMTAMRTMVPLLLGGVPGLLLGLAMGWSGRLRRAAEPFVSAFHPIPKLALLPLFIVVLGIGEAPKLLVVAVAAFFPILINSMTGVREIDGAHFDLAKNYGASPARVLWRIVLPGSLPFVLAGVRLAANIALVTAVAVEMIAARDGLGARVWLSWQVLRTEQLYATLVVIGVAGTGLHALLGAIEKRLLPWRTERTARA